MAKREITEYHFCAGCKKWVGLAPSGNIYFHRGLCPKVTTKTFRDYITQKYPKD